MADDPASVTTSHQVRKANRADVAGLARTLAHAFYEDPVFRWLLPDDAHRLQINERFFALALSRIWIRHEETYAAAGTAGAAVWVPPDMWRMGAFEQLSLLPAFVRTVGRRLPRLLSSLYQLQKHHPTESHHYLAVVGVDPTRQGRGIGSAVLRPVLARCDADRMPAYLEASSPRNRVLYERHGFEVVEEIRVGRGSPPVWPMWRAPRPDGGGPVPPPPEPN